jgi:hypothetical protein
MAADSSLTTVPPDPSRAAVAALWAGIAFSLGVTVLTWVLDRVWLEVPVLAPDRPGMWYEWQRLEPTAWSRASAWIGYLLHQVTIWGLIWWAQRERPDYTGGLHRFNWIALAANAFFIVLHLVQTALWYDGLAQDVHEATAQWSVILLLMAVVVMENQRRGLVFGRPVGFVTESAGAIRRYHGYYFAWATIYTFWYHPMIGTSGHLAGFLYMFLMLLQGSLFFTRAHTNRYWMVTQELAVAAHGALVAWMQAGAWEMFLCGFLGMFVITQMHGLGWSRAVRWVVGVGYVGLVAFLYSDQAGRALLVLGIPATIIPGALVLSLTVLVLQRWLLRRSDRNQVVTAKA